MIKKYCHYQLEQTNRQRSKKYLSLKLHYEMSNIGLYDPNCSCKNGISNIFADLIAELSTLTFTTKKNVSHRYSAFYSDGGLECTYSQPAGNILF